MKMTISRTLALTKFKRRCKTILRNLIQISNSIHKRLNALSRVATYLDLIQRKLVIKAFILFPIWILTTSVCAFHSKRLNESKYSRMDKICGRQSLKNLKGYGLLKQIFSTNFTWSILEYFAPNNCINNIHERNIRIVHRGCNISFKDLLELDNTVPTYQKNLRNTCSRNS